MVGDYECGKANWLGRVVHIGEGPGDLFFDVDVALGFEHVQEFSYQCRSIKNCNNLC